MDSCKPGNARKFLNIRLQYWLPLADRRAEFQKGNPSWHIRATLPIKAVHRVTNLHTEAGSPHTVVVSRRTVVLSRHTGVVRRQGVVSRPTAQVSRPTAGSRRSRVRRSIKARQAPTECRHTSTPTGFPALALT